MDENSPHSLLRYLNDLQIPGSSIVICAHGNPKTIGSQNTLGIGPELLADLFYYTLGDENIALLPTIELQTCNSGWSPESDDQSILGQSYTGLFFQSLVERGALNIAVIGYRGFIHEERGKPYAYVTPQLGEGRKKQRCIEQQVVISNGGDSIEKPERPLIVNFEGTEFDPDLLFKVLKDQFCSSKLPVRETKNNDPEHTVEIYSELDKMDEIESDSDDLDDLTESKPSLVLVPSTTTDLAQLSIFSQDSQNQNLDETLSTGSVIQSKTG